MAPSEVLNEFLDFERGLMKNMGWDIETVESQPYFLLVEVMSEKRKNENPNNDVGQMNLGDFIRTGGIASIFQKGGK